LGDEGEVDGLGRVNPTATIGQFFDSNDKRQLDPSKFDIDIEGSDDSDDEDEPPTPTRTGPPSVSIVAHPYERLLTLHRSRSP
jgi:hypothetical protein